MPPHILRLEDADFPHHFARCWSKLEGSSLRWVPFGMPRINQSFERAVFFLYGRTKEGELRPSPSGSGVFFSHGLTIGAVTTGHFYALTSAHVVEQANASNIRINTKDGKSRFIEIDPEEWKSIPGGADVAAIDITERLRDTDKFSCISQRWFAGQEFIDRVDLGPGEDGFMLGLFAGHFGKSANVVAARFGNLSMVANPDVPIRQENGTHHPAHLFDMRSRGGFSGSPVFIFRTPEGDLREVDFGVRRRTTIAPRVENSRISERDGPQIEWHLEHDTENNIFVAFLGIHAGQFPEKVKVNGDELEMPGGVTVVIPVWDIVELLNMESFMKQRHEREAWFRAHIAEENIARGEADFSEVADAATPEPSSPSHKEDFTRLLNAAAKVKPQDD